MRKAPGGEADNVCGPQARRPSPQSRHLASGILQNFRSALRAAPKPDRGQGTQEEAQEMPLPQPQLPTTKHCHLPPPFFPHR